MHLFHRQTTVVRILSIVAFLLIFGGLLALWRIPKEDAPGVQGAEEVPRASNFEEKGTEKFFDFVFDDDTAIAIPDPRLESRTYLFEEQSVGVMLLAAEGEDSKAPESFGTWLLSVSSTVRIGEQEVAAERQKIRGRDVLLFVSEESGEKAANAMLEIEGRVFLVQSRGSTDLLARFLQKIVSLRR